VKIAIIGAGVSGLYAAWHLARDHEVLLFEASERLGGHADTQIVDGAGGRIPVDSGFIVFNEANYPLFTRWLEALGVAWKASDMSFAVSDRVSGIEYNATRLGTLFCQRRNLFRLSFLGMVRDILRFYRRAPALLDTLDDRITLGDWLADSGMGRAFGELHLLPMASALWSAPMGKIRDFPMRHLLAFMDHHTMLQIDERPQWKTIDGGSIQYVERAARACGEVHRSTPVRQVLREADRVRIRTDQGEVQVDEVILACHSDQALAMLGDASSQERSVLGAIPYQANETVLHTDTRLLPRIPSARASWNVRRDPEDAEQCRVSYYMNLLQGIEGPTDYIVSLNQTELIDPALVLVKRHYQHPVFTPEAVMAQRRWNEINGQRRTWFCGAWWGWGFHEDGTRSAQRVIDHLITQGDV
jgi:predicted NAD/FAD-binding protein